MLVLVCGGAASGKSALAESFCTQLGGPLLYVATMPVHGKEAQQRIAKHRAMRAGKGFDTVEWYDTLHEKQLVHPSKTVLLECLSNLCANEMFGQKITPSALPQRLADGVLHLQQQAQHVVVVTNEIFSGAEYYEGEMQAYLEALSQTNRLLAQRADSVLEAVCGLAVTHKGDIKRFFV